MGDNGKELKILSWNVNGLRALLQEKNKSLSDFLTELKADIICFQETKLAQSDLSESLARPAGFDAFYSCSKSRLGYSGVATFCQTKTVSTLTAEQGLTSLWSQKLQDPVGFYSDLEQTLPQRELRALDIEGRCLITEFPAFVLLNVYCPSLRQGERMQFKLRFHQLLQSRIEALQEVGKNVVVVGDINISHREIDHCDPKPIQMENGHLQKFEHHPCRQWMDSILLSYKKGNCVNNGELQLDVGDNLKLVDCFRYFHPLKKQAFTCWNTVTEARKTNYGTRIDYILASKDIVSKYCSNCQIDNSIIGSDHCPVILSCSAELKSYVSTKKTATFCSKYMIEFSGNQQSLHSFLKRKQSIGLDDTQPKKKCNQTSIKSFFVEMTKISKPVSRPSLQFSSAMLSSTRNVSELKNENWSSVRSQSSISEWNTIFDQKMPSAPLCTFHQLPCVLRKVAKKNQNWGKKFYVCSKPEGKMGDPNARCGFFKWFTK